jgi:hypothetical protein
VNQNQWFHGQPLSFVDATGQDNDFQDYEFWYREKEV